MRYVQDPGTLELVPKSEYAPPAKVHILGDYEPYQCPKSGLWISGRAAHRANLDRHGCHTLEAGEHEDAERKREANLKAFRDKVKQTARDICAERGLFPA